MIYSEAMPEFRDRTFSHQTNGRKNPSVQSRPVEQSPGELKREEVASGYARMFSALPGIFRRATKELNDMRLRGYPTAMHTIRFGKR